MPGERNLRQKDITIHWNSKSSHCTNMTTQHMNTTGEKDWE